MTKLWILGGGGHGRSVIDAARSSGQYDVVGVLDDGPDSIGTSVSGVPVRGPISVDSLRKFDVENAIIAIGDNRVRAALARRFDGYVQWATVIHAWTYVAPNSVIGAGTVICAGAVVQPAAVLGSHVIANTSCSIGHDSIVGDFTHVAPGTNLAGGVSIGEGAFLGLNSGVIPVRRVGAWSTIGAGGIVIEDIPDGATAVGIPARVITLCGE